MSDCLFCKIIAGEIPSTKIYEDDKIYVFADIAPAAPVHYLFIPKEHIQSAAAVTPENSAVVAHIFEKIAEIAKGDEFKDGFRVVSNCGDAAGQTVKHLHFHLLAGREFTWPAG
ncbi:MAG: histidine triad nucleotide-binding protein [Oscillospiraceae bacterium]|nr:histidine triad nucleotide-binding protein [Oscillospiraceae bacterium]